MGKSKGGRPRHGEQVKAAPLSMRIDPNLKTILEQSMDARRRENPRWSLTQEVESRLYRSFESEERRMLTDEAWEALMMACQRSGRPVEAELNKAVLDALRDGVVTFLRPGLRRQLEEEAQQLRLPLSALIVERVSSALSLEDFFGGSETARLLKAIGTAIEAAEAKTGQKWHSDPRTWLAARTAVDRLYALNAPPPDGDDAEGRSLADIRDEANRLWEELQRRRQALTEYFDAHPEFDQQVNDIANGVEPPAKVEAAVMREFLRLRGAVTETSERYQTATEALRGRMKEIRDLRSEMEGIGRDAADHAMAGLRVTINQHIDPVLEDPEHGR